MLKRKQARETPIETNDTVYYFMISIIELDPFCHRSTPEIVLDVDGFVGCCHDPVRQFQCSILSESKASDNYVLWPEAGKR